jgi:cytochrome P450
MKLSPDIDPFVDARTSGGYVGDFNAEVFDAPDEIRIDRAQNPHVGFGAGDHACVGAAQARAMIRALLSALADLVARIDLHDATPGTRDIGGITRGQGFARLSLSLQPR